MSLGAFLIGVLIGAGRVGDPDPLLRAILAAASIFLGFFGFYHGVRHRKHQHIDISGTGQIRLVETGDTGPCAAANRPHLKKNGQVVHLLPSSTLWRRMLLLRLRTGSGRIITVPVMPDSVSQDSFRALSVACRWILSRNDSTDTR
ncbi:protein YgfX [Noviherbaspirillum aridicola]|uniref:protein YgfX n=1 Tax=Noviherbaspirillum aridicola TaxID=2849687 RepID=UPI001C81B18E|nr:protein YgfX [Noviherbaspirillum aridicola]